MDYVTNVLYPILSDNFTPQLGIHSVIPLQMNPSNQLHNLSVFSLRIGVNVYQLGGDIQNRFVSPTLNAIKLTDEVCELIRLFELRDFNASKQCLE